MSAFDRAMATAYQAMRGKLLVSPVESKLDSPALPRHFGPGKMPKLRSILVFALLIGSLSAEPPAPASVDASSRIRKAMAGARSVSVFEGLPHQGFETDLLAVESKRRDTVKLGSFRFYTPADEATNPEILKGILSSSATIQIFRGEKLCGGFHPDYAVLCTSDDGSLFLAQICLGCHEIIYSDGKKGYRYDLEKEAFEKLKNALAPYAKKRPRSKR